MRRSFKFESYYFVSNLPKLTLREISYVFGVSRACCEKADLRRTRIHKLTKYSLFADCYLICMSGKNYKLPIYL